MSALRLFQGIVVPFGTFGISAIVISLVFKQNVFEYLGLSEKAQSHLFTCRSNNFTGFLCLFYPGLSKTEWAVKVALLCRVAENERVRKAKQFATRCFYKWMVMALY